jgi:hypothetical protein
MRRQDDLLDRGGARVRATRRLAVVVVALACAVAVPAAASGRGDAPQGGGTLHLTGVVEGPMHPESGEQCTYPSKLDLLEGGRSVGVIHFRKCILFAATDLKYRGSVELGVGRLSGKLRVGINFTSDAQGQLPWGEGPVWKRVAGSSYKKVAEHIRVKNSGEEPPIPTKEGARVEVELKPSRKFPPQTATQ